MRVQITLIRVQPEIQAQATWVINAQIKAVGIVVCHAGAVVFVKESESLLRSFSATLLASGLYGLKRRQVIYENEIDLIHFLLFRISCLSLVNAIKEQLFVQECEIIAKLFSLASTLFAADL